LAALAGGRPLHAALVTGLLLAAVSAVAVRDIWRRSPFRIGVRGGAWAESLALLGPSLTFFVVALTTQMLTTGVTVAISALAGAAAVAVFATTLMLSNFVRLVVNQGMNVLWPEVTAAAAQADAGRLQRWHRLALKAVGLIILGAGAGIGLAGPGVLAVWTGGEIRIDAALNWLFVFYLLAHGPALVSGVFGLAMNRQAQLMRVNGLAALASLALAGALLPALGVAGAALALAVGQLVATTLILWLACAWTGDTWAGLWRAVGMRGLPAALAALAGAGLLDMALADGLGVRLVAALGVALVLAAAGWWLWFTHAERGLLAGQAQALLGRAGGRARVREVSI
jgi:O-antigen/teichoic acid export membrane protein